MGAGATESWQERQDRRQQVAEQARAMRREPASSGPRAALGLGTVLWLAVLVWLFLTLPERVPTHWSFGSVPDGWSSRPVALTMAALLPILTAYPLLWLSRLAIIWPSGINVPDQEWWLQTPDRLVRFERLLREDLMLMVAVMLLLFTAGSLQMAWAAHQPQGAVPAWSFPVLVGGFLVMFGLVLARMVTGPRYRPRKDDRL